ncbi:MAG: response regulator, partial [Ruminococcus sp.]|nr:response regulator [Ruminococcus sp.]
MRLLVVEDETQLADALTEILKRNKYFVDTAYDGIDGLDCALSDVYDCILLDIMLPGMNGMEILKRLRSAKISTPVLLLTARSEIDDKINGLDCGADDYLTKPFITGELLARIRALTRRK